MEIVSPTAFRTLERMHAPRVVRGVGPNARGVDRGVEVRHNFTGFVQYDANDCACVMVATALGSALHPHIAKVPAREQRCERGARLLLDHSVVLFSVLPFEKCQ